MHQNWTLKYYAKWDRYKYYIYIYIHRQTYKEQKKQWLPEAEERS